MIIRNSYFLIYIYDIFFFIQKQQFVEFSLCSKNYYNEIKISTIEWEINNFTFARFVYPWKYICTYYKLFCINRICMFIWQHSDFKSTLTYMFIVHVTVNVLPNSSKWQVIEFPFALGKMNIWSKIIDSLK